MADRRTSQEATGDEMVAILEGKPSEVDNLKALEDADKLALAGQQARIDQAQEAVKVFQEQVGELEEAYAGREDALKATKVFTRLSVELSNAEEAVTREVAKLASIERSQVTNKYMVPLLKAIGPIVTVQDIAHFGSSLDIAQEHISIRDVNTGELEVTLGGGVDALVTEEWERLATAQKAIARAEDRIALYSLIGRAILATVPEEFRTELRPIKWDKAHSSTTMQATLTRVVGSVRTGNGDKASGKAFGIASAIGKLQTFVGMGVGVGQTYPNAISMYLAFCKEHEPEEYTKVTGTTSGGEKVHFAATDKMGLSSTKFGGKMKVGDSKWEKKYKVVWEAIGDALADAMEEAQEQETEAERNSHDGEAVRTPAWPLP